jgi:cysteine desulfurase/selenocysteine lyase
MSTSDLPGGVGDFDNVIDLTGSKAASAAGLPDPAQLVSLATEFFGALSRDGVPDPAQLPDMTSVPAMPGMAAMPGVPAVPDMPTASLPPAFSFLGDVRAIEDMARGGSTPSESQLRSVAAVTPAMPGVQSIPAMGGAEGMPSTSGMSALPPAFSFLTDIRAIEDMARVPGMPAPQSTGWGSTPSESQLRSAAAVTPAMPGVQSVPAMGGTDGMPGMPSMPGMSAPFPALAFPTDFGSTPSESQLRSAAAVTPAMPGVQSIPWMGGAEGMPTMAGMPGMPAMPGMPGLPPAFSFLGDVRAIEELARGPALPGAVTPLPASWSDPTSFGFVEFLRPLESLGAGPVAGAIPSDLGGLKAADITSIPFDVQAIRRDFPILQETFNGRPLVWLDNAATTQKPQAVIDRLSYFYAHENSNVHRAAHQLAARATDAYEAARETVRRFINASSTSEIVFVRGTTEGINLIAQAWGRRNIRKDDEIVITWLEHHANIVPWQMLCAEKGAKLRVAPVDDSGQVLLDEYERLLGPRTKLVSFSHVSNALGTVTPAKQMIEMAHRYGAKVVVDGAQSVAHTQIDVQLLDCDFFVFSGHKIFAPTGVGVVYGRADVLEHMPPWQGGGNMIKDVTFEKTIYNDPPVRFEAGTGTIADAVGLGAALDYVSRVGLANIAAYEHDLLDYGTEVLRRIPGLRLIGTAPEKASVLSFVIDGYRNEDIGAALAREGIAVRAGHHCAQPILRRFGLESSVRPSLAFYNTCDELDALGAALWRLTSGQLRV